MQIRTVPTLTPAMLTDGVVVTQRIGSCDGRGSAPTMFWMNDAIMIVAFIPMLFIAVAYYYLNRVDPDCGATFDVAAPATGRLASQLVLPRDELQPGQILGFVAVEQSL